MPTLLFFLHFLDNQTFKFKKYAGKSLNKVSRQYMPIFIEIVPITCKISRFESNFPEIENHKFTIFQTNQYGERIKDVIHLITYHFVLKVHISQFVFYRIIFSKNNKINKLLQTNLS